MARLRARGLQEGEIVRWVVGDVQGCVREFEDLLEAARFDPSHDVLYLVGDLVNGGHDSLAALRLWRDVGGRGVLGNHDIHAIEAGAGRSPRRRKNLEALLAAPDAEDLLERLRSLPVLEFLPGEGRGPDTWIVHAGFHPTWDDLPALAARINPEPHDADWLRSAEVRFATRVRCCTPEGKRSRFSGPPDACPPGHRPWDFFYRGEALVVHGHWACRGLYRGERTLGLDSGCAYGGPLSAWCLEEDRIVQVPSRSGVRRGV